VSNASIPPRFCNFICTLGMLRILVTVSPAQQRRSTSAGEAAYQQGMKALQDGDLAAARVAFEKAVSRRRAVPMLTIPWDGF